MKRFAFLVLVCAAVIIAEEADTKQSSDSSEYDEAVHICRSESKITDADLEIVIEELIKTQGDSIDDKIKNNFDKFKVYTACILEKLGLMENSKLNIEKLMGDAEEEMDNLVIKECLNKLNNNSELTREDRAIGMRICALKYGSTENNDKKE